MSCSHQNMYIIAETTLPSPYEQLEGDILFDALIKTIRRMGVRFFQKKHIIVLFCPDCGKLKKIVEVNPS